MATELTAQQGFDSAYYLAEKAAALTKSTGQTWTAAQVEVAFAEAGLTPSQHYLLYGYNEGLAPNAYFSKDEYAASKAAAAGVTIAEFISAWQAASGSNNVFLHYIQYGSFETGVNPSSGFNDQDYYEAKASMLVGTTWEEVRDAIQAAGLNAISHYQLYGISEGVPYTPTPIPVSGETYTLTTGVDTITGTAGDDTVNGVIAATSTLNVFDSIDGAGGTNTLNVNFANTAAALFDATVSPTLNHIQVFNMSTMNGNMALDGSVLPDMTTLNVANQGTTGIVTATKISENVTTFGLSNITTDATDLNVTFATGAKSGSTDAATLNLSGVKSTTNDQTNSSEFNLNGASAGLGVEQVTVNTTSESRLGALTSEDSVAGTSVLNTLTFTGAGAAEILGVLDFNDTTNVGIIDASNSTGGVTLLVGTEDITFTGGTGNDRLNFNAAGDLTSADTISFGSGTNTLGLADTTFTTALYSLVNATGAEKVAFTAGITADMSKLTAATVVVDNNIAGNTFTKLAATDTVEVTTAMQTGTVNLTASLGFNTANVNLLGTSTSDVDIATLTTTNQTIVNIDSVGTLATNDITTFTNTANTAINVTGSGTGLNLGTLGASAILTATGYTGTTFSVTGANAASSFTTGSAADTITLGTLAGGDIVNTGAGNDTIITAAVTGTTATEITGGLGKDTITVTDPGAVATACKLTLNATAEESYATANKYDVVNFANATATDTLTATLNTGLNTTSLAAATSATVGTTTFAVAGGILWVNTTGSTAALNENAVLYQDSNANGLLDATDLRMDFNVAGTDTIGISLVNSQATIAFTGV